jgi:zinc transport system substrate-binding protein
MLTLIQRVTEDRIPVVYAIELSTQTVAKTVAEETGAEILTLHSMQTVTQDEFDAGESYVSIMTRNLEAVRKGLS